MLNCIDDNGPQGSSQLRWVPPQVKSQPAYIRPPWLSISLPQTSCLGIAENRQTTKKYLIAEQVTIPSIQLCKLPV